MRSKAIPSRFPLFVHETFKMEGNYKDILDVSTNTIEQLLCNEPIDFALWQNGRRLAHYTDRLGRILHHNGHGTVTIELIMIPSSCFPGRLAPKLKMQTFCDIVSNDNNEQQRYNDAGVPSEFNNRRILFSTDNEKSLLNGRPPLIKKGIKSAVCHSIVQKISRCKSSYNWRKNDQRYLDEPLSYQNNGISTAR